MSKYNKRGAVQARTAGPVSPMTTTGPATTHEGGAGFTRDAKSELYLTAVTNMVGEDTFYESAQKRDDRYVNLVRQVVLEDPAWAFRFLGWLRNKANMRSASVVFAAEAVRVRLEHRVGGTFDASLGGEPGHAVQLGTKDFVWQGMARADEPGEFVAYWLAKYGPTPPKDEKGVALKHYSKSFPMAVKRGMNIAIDRLFTEYAYAKYGQSSGSEWGLADIVEMMRPKTDVAWKNDLYRHAIEERHHRGLEIPDSLELLQARKDFLATPPEDRRTLLDHPEVHGLMRGAGLTWEALSGWLGGELDAKFWESLIFSGQLGYMALLRNLRNFEKAGISKAARAAVCTRLAAPGEVARSRQFPFRFLSAYKAVQSDWWSLALSDALDLSVDNLPVLTGRTLVLVDTSASMNGVISAKSTVTHAEIGALFGVALARAGRHVDLHGFAGGSWSQHRVSFKHELPQGGSLLKGIRSFCDRIGEVGHGTRMVEALEETYGGHDRVILVTDMQSFASYGGAQVTSAVPADVKMYGINPSGYSSTALDLSQRNRYEIGGFSDQVFRMIGLLEAGDANWPF